MNVFARYGLYRAVLLVAILALAGCLGSRKTAEDLPPDERFGHRFDEESVEAGRTMNITPPDSAKQFFYYTATFDTVHVRPAPFSLGKQETQVEVLVKGAMPDACTELHSVKQERAGHIISMILATRRPQGAICASVRRPYRFYVMLDGMYEPGNYTLKLNGDVFAFEVNAPPEQTG